MGTPHDETRDPESESCADSGSEPQLLADQMLGRLARWLRLLGYDCALVAKGGPTGEDLAERACGEGRILLTCARALAAAHPDGVALIPHAPLPDQARAVLARLPLDVRRTAFTRCSVCNAPVEAVEFDSVADRLPTRVRERRPAVTRCPICDRLYWTGTHVAALRKVFEEQLNWPDVLE